MINAQPAHKKDLSTASLERLTSKLMHDLITPIGAISSGLELLESHMAPANDVLPLLRESVDKALTLLVVFRGGWGHSSSSLINFQEGIKPLFERLAALKKHYISHCDLQLDPPTNIFRAAVSLLYLIGDTFMPGAAIQVTSMDNSLQLDLTGKMTKSLPQLEQLLQVSLEEAKTAQILWAVNQKHLLIEGIKLDITPLHDGLSIVLLSA